MERLTFGRTPGHPQHEVPEVRLDPHDSRAIPESEIAPKVADPLPGESSDWAFGGLLAFTALLFFRPQDQVPALASLHLAEASAIVGLGAMAAKRLARGLPATRITLEIICLVGFGVVLAATSISSYWPGGSIEVLTGMYVKVFLIVILMANSITTVARLERFAWLVVVASGYLSARAVFDYVRGVNLVEGGRVAGAVGGIFGNPNDLALNMVAFLPFAIFFALRPPVRNDAGVGAAAVASRKTAPTATHRRPRRPSAGFWPWLAGACALLMLLAVVFTKSRSGFLGMIVMLIPVIWAGRRLRPGLGIGLLVLMVASIPALPSTFWQRMGSILDPTEDPTGSREARRQVMSEALQVFLERPLTGIGPGQFKNYNPPEKQERWREAHDVWLQVASETGIGGLLAFAFLVVAAFEAAASTRRRLRRSLPASAPRGPDGHTRRGRVRSALSWPLSDGFAGGLASRDVAILYLHATALVAALWGWMVCAIFASVAYNWTFYYLLGMCIATRDLTQARLATTAPERPAHAPGRRIEPQFARP